MSSDDPNKSIAKRQIARLIGSSDIPMYVLDEQDVLVYANERMLDCLNQLTECGASTIEPIGLDCSILADNAALRRSDSASDVTLRGLATKLAPPTLWDRASVHLGAWDAQFTRILIPLESNKEMVRNASPSSTLLALLVPERLADIYLHLRSSSTERTSLSAEAMAPELNSLWLAAGGSLKAHLFREQLEMASGFEGATFILGESCKEREEIAITIARSRASRQGVPFQAASFIRVDCHLMDHSLLESVLEAVDEVIRAFGARASLHLSRLDELPEELLLAIDRYLSSRPQLVTYATSRRALHEDRAPGSLWHRLWLRLSTLRIELPSVRERLEDFDPLLASWFQARQRGVEQGLRVRSDKTARHLVIASPAKEALLAYPWPGSYEELAMVMEACFQQAKGDEIQLSNLPIALRTSPSHFERPPAVEPLALDEVLEQVEKQLIMEALERCKGNRTAASKLLSISRARMIRRLQQWGLMPDSVSGEDEPDQDMPQFEEIPDE
ncbi:MAG: hypothetical protein MUD03_15855 [Pirellula sp.]|jgi:DNA-binding NtrC family response regulator|nr:hypothetical protein [Pirellula sp.]